ncbi:MAG: hypothetical protein ACK5V3_08585 [Bdellovibrionales bacterium]
MFKKIVASLLLVVSGISQAEPIVDNSFLVEEAFNQEPGVVQFINVFTKSEKGRDWNYTFINEIPVIDETHQFSYEIPYSSLEAVDKKGVEDIKLNYRRQFFANDKIITTGRVSATVANGDYKKGFGKGSMGYEASLITSVQITDKWYQHWNLGAGITPDAKATNGDKADNSKYFWAMSNVYLFSDNLNFMLEFAGSEEEETTGANTATYGSSVVMSPSLRYAVNVGEWQFVPGIAYPMGVTSNAGENEILVYLSIEGKLF